MSSSGKNWKRLVSLLLAPLYVGLGGCQSWENFTKTPQQESVELRGPTPHRNRTPMEEALTCLRQAAPNAGGYRVGVAEFVDGTGSIEGLAMNSRVFSQRPDYMMIVGLKSAGVHLVNRSSVNVAEWEMKQAMEQKLGDGHKVRMEQAEVLFRPIQAGSILGSTHYVTGAITELNWNISSNLAEGSAFGASAGGRTYRVSLAVDVMVTDTVTTEVVHARSYKKQLVGYETEAGFFRFIEKNHALGYTPYGVIADKALELFQANIGDKTNEPNQTALRWVIELAAYDLVRSLTRRGTECDSMLPPGSLDLDLPGGGLGPNPEAVVATKGGPRMDGRRRADAGVPQELKAASAAAQKPAQAPATAQASDPASQLGASLPGMAGGAPVPPAPSGSSTVMARAAAQGAVQ